MLNNNTKILLVSFVHHIELQNFLNAPRRSHHILDPPVKYNVISYHTIPYHIVVLKNRLKVGTDKPKLKVEMQSVSDDDVRKRLVEKPRSELAAKGVY